MTTKKSTTKKSTTPNNKPAATPRRQPKPEPTRVERHLADFAAYAKQWRAHAAIPSEFPTAVYAFGRAVIAQCQLRRLGCRDNVRPWTELVLAASELRGAIMSEYDTTMIGLHLVESFEALCTEIDERAEFLAPDADNSFDDAEAAEDLQYRVFQELVAWDEALLLHAELKAMWPDENFDEADSVFRHWADAVANLYLPPVTAQAIAKYAADYCIGEAELADRPFLSRPTIAELPLFLPCQLADVETEAMLAHIAKHPIEVPAAVTERAAARQLAMVQKHPGHFCQARPGKQL